MNPDILREPPSLTSYDEWLEFFGIASPSERMSRCRGSSGDEMLDLFTRVSMQQVNWPQNYALDRTILDYFLGICTYTHPPSPPPSAAVLLVRVRPVPVRTDRYPRPPQRHPLRAGADPRRGHRGTETGRSRRRNALHGRTGTFCTFCIWTFIEDVSIICQPTDLDSLHLFVPRTKALRGLSLLQTVMKKSEQKITEAKRIVTLSTIR